MTYSRRKTLALIGGGTVVAAAAGVGLFASTRTPTAALAPWDRAGQYADPRLRAMSYALLAPNPHNRQPWEAELVGDDTVRIWRDSARDLPVTDPLARQLTIGMGCFLDLMRMAAAEEGYGIDQTLFPDGEIGPVAVCRFVAGAVQPDPLFAHVLERRSHKEVFADRPLDAASVDIITPRVDLLAQGDEAQALRDLATEAWLIEAATHDAWKESIDLLRIGKAEIDAQPDGIDLGGPMFEALSRMGLLTREASLDPTTMAAQGAIQGTVDAIASAAGLVLLTSSGNTRADQIATGARWLQLNLAATGAGLGVRPVSQALQEYPEMAAPYTAIHQAYAPDRGTVQMLGLLGYASATPRTPRWPLETRMRPIPSNA
ncbi:Acg family FMN-binding oxidoreductase [Marivita sp.]|uniref:Acg family FMN-binding oxidoreductase n=1 Tax=Marivita sp. TaxID=2003365 RepID=UPI003A88CBA7